MIRKLNSSIGVLTFFITLCAASAFAQKIDSVKYSNGHLFYHEYGKGETIILLTGGPGNNCSQLADMAARLSINNRVILLEERGTGLSIPDPLDSSTINLQTAASDINLLLDHLGLKEAIICGHSWGATLALYFTSLFPGRVKSLIIVSPSSLLMGGDLRQTFQFNRSARLSTGEKKRFEILSQKVLNSTLTPEELKEYNYLIISAFVSDRERMDSLMPKINVPKNQKTSQLIFKDAGKSKMDLRTSLASFKKPVFIIEGRQDILNFAGYEFKILFPSYELYWIQNCGHYPMFEQPESFYNIMVTVLAKMR